MVTRLNPYLNFEGQAREALEFYHAALGGTIEMMTFGQAGMGDAAIAELVMHGAVVSDGGLTIYAADVPTGMMDPPVPGTQVTVSLSSDDADLRPYWDKLTEGAEISAPFEIAPWGDRYGSFTDKFGIGWLMDQNGDL